MPGHTVVSHADWLTARKELLQKEKELTRQRDELTRQRLQLPWEKVDKDYTFTGPEGELSLADLFGEHSQLLVYHFMFGPDWDAGCKVCSFLADHYNPLVLHLKHRDVSLVTVSRAPLDKLETYKQRFGWTFPWVSSLNSDFNWDYQVSFNQEDVDNNTVSYNYADNVSFPVEEGPGFSAFFKEDDGDIFHTYSTYSRGLENLLGIYNFLDLAPKGRDEDDLPYGMFWVQRRDEYDDDSIVDPYA